MICKRLRDAWVRRLLEKRVKMAANGSNCADIDATLKRLGYKSDELP